MECREKRVSLKIQCYDDWLVPPLGDKKVPLMVLLGGAGITQEKGLKS